jgi:hypothetical protein
MCVHDPFPSMEERQQRALGAKRNAHRAEAAAARDEANLHRALAEAHRARARTLDEVAEATSALADTYVDPDEAERTRRMAGNARTEAEQFRRLATVDDSSVGRYDAEVQRADQEASSTDAILMLINSGDGARF